MYIREDGQKVDAQGSCGGCSVHQLTSYGLTIKDLNAAVGSQYKDKELLIMKR